MIERFQMMFARSVENRRLRRAAENPDAEQEEAPPNEEDENSYKLDPKTQLANDVSRDTRVRGRPMGGKPVNALKLLHSREAGGGALQFGAGFSKSERCHMSMRYIPTDLTIEEDGAGRGQAYIGQFSNSGKLFTAVFGPSVRIYDADNGWSLKKEVFARHRAPRDTAMSPCERFLTYASMSPVVHLLSVGDDDSIVQSIANVTEIHEALDFATDGHRFALFTLRFSADGREIIAGSNDRSLYLWDLEANRRALRLEGHDDDINAVSFLDDTSNLLVTGSDDTYIKIWDRRALRHNGAAGVLVGHTQGISFIDAKMDGRHIISNGKDQCIKLWDIRKMTPQEDFDRLPDTDKVVASGRHFLWDYYRPYPPSWRSVRHPLDASLATFRGHRVLRTLIRCYFSPRFIYTGSQCGAVHVYDTVTGKLVKRLRRKGSRVLVRDCSWHPRDPTIVAVWWDGALGKWEFRRGPEGEGAVGGIGRDGAGGSSSDEEDGPPMWSPGGGAARPMPSGPSG